MGNSRKSKFKFMNFFEISIDLFSLFTVLRNLQLSSYLQRACNSWINTLFELDKFLDLIGIKICLKGNYCQTSLTMRWLMLFWVVKFSTTFRDWTRNWPYFVSFIQLSKIGANQGNFVKFRNFDHRKKLIFFSNKDNEVKIASFSIVWPYVTWCHRIFNG